VLSAIHFWVAGCAWKKKILRELNVGQFLTKEQHPHLSLALDKPGSFATCSRISLALESLEASLLRKLE